MEPISPFPEMARKGSYSSSQTSSTSSSLAFQSFPHFSLRCGMTLRIPLPPIHMHQPSVSMGCRKHCTAPTTCQLNIELNNQPRPQNYPKGWPFLVILNTTPYLPGTPNDRLFVKVKLLNPPKQGRTSSRGVGISVPGSLTCTIWNLHMESLNTLTPEVHNFWQHQEG